MGERTAAMINTAGVLLPCAVCVHLGYAWAGFGVAAFLALGWTWLGMSWRRLARDWQELAKGEAHD